MTSGPSSSTTGTQAAPPVHSQAPAQAQVPGTLPNQFQGIQNIQLPGSMPTSMLASIVLPVQQVSIVGPGGEHEVAQLQAAFHLLQPALPTPAATTGIHPTEQVQSQTQAPTSQPSQVVPATAAATAQPRVRRFPRHTVISILGKQEYEPVDGTFEWTIYSMRGRDSPGRRDMTVFKLLCVLLAGLSIFLAFRLFK
jgi:hypothetical protein